MTASSQVTRVCAALVVLIAASCKSGSEYEMRAAKANRDADPPYESVPKPSPPTGPPHLRLAANFAHDHGDTIIDNFAAGHGTVALGDRGGDRDRGSVRTWTRDERGVWSEGQRIEAPKASGRAFGQAVTVFGRWMAVGDPDCAKGTDPADDPPPCSGVVHLYREEDGEWRYKQRLDDELRYPSKLAPAGSRFGRKLSMAEGILLVSGDLGTWLYELEGERWVSRSYQHQCGPYVGVLDAATNDGLTAYSFPEPKKLGSCHNGLDERFGFQERHRKVAALRIELRERVADQWRTMSEVTPSTELFIPSVRNRPTAHVELCGNLLLLDDGRLFSAYRRVGEGWSAVSSAWINRACDPGRWIRSCFFACSREHVVAGNFGGSGPQLHYGTPDEPSPRILPMPEGTLPSHVAFAAGNDLLAVAYRRDKDFNDKRGGPRLPSIRGLAIFEWSDAPSSAP